MTGNEIANVDPMLLGVIFGVAIVCAAILVYFIVRKIVGERKLKKRFAKEKVDRTRESEITIAVLNAMRQEWTGEMRERMVMEIREIVREELIRHDNMTDTEKEIAKEAQNLAQNRTSWEGVGGIVL